VRRFSVRTKWDIIWLLGDTNSIIYGFAVSFDSERCSGANFVCERRYGFAVYGKAVSFDAKRRSFDANASLKKWMTYSQSTVSVAKPRDALRRTVSVAKPRDALRRIISPYVNYTQIFHIHLYLHLLPNIQGLHQVSPYLINYLLYT